MYALFTEKKCFPWKLTAILWFSFYVFSCHINIWIRNWALLETVKNIIWDLMQYSQKINLELTNNVLF